MKMFKALVTLVLVAFAAVAPLHPQNRHTASTSSHPASLPEDFLYDDDGGRAQIVLPSIGSDWNVIYHHGPFIQEPQQESIFIGNAWAEPALRAREAELSQLADFCPDPDLAQLASFGVRVRTGTGRVEEDFTDFDQTSSMTDLQVQRMLTRMLESRAISAPTSNIIYVVYLAPGMQSMLGGNRAGKDYLAYHNFFHSELGLMQYAVVPFEEDRDRDQKTAWRAFAQTVLDPTDEGWY